MLDMKELREHFAVHESCLVMLLLSITLLTGKAESAEPKHSTDDARGLLPKMFLNFAGQVRTYRLYIPHSYDRTKPAPLVLVIHGGGGDSEGMISLTLGGFNALAERDRFIVVYPEGIEKNWNDKREGVKKSRAHMEKIDDVGFLCFLVDELVKRYNIDVRHVYATGISNGGHMSLCLACEKPDRFAAVAAVTAELPESLAKCTPSEPVSVLIMNGTKDRLVPWDGGTIGGFLGGRGRDISTEETVKFWVRHNVCPAEPRVVQEPDVDPNDGTRVRRETYGLGKNGTEVVLYVIENGGHTWPDGHQYLKESLVGKTTRDINACEVVWRFFAKHSK
ncbi:MAG: PHB depolymerase family esterase [Kiritimatiellae bacterium]|nr:PHB depolymerase family esterase [Kiritimatiellia bacterium]MDD5519812.1 PHB depolymerase family esterase [Kiritimatiellia bacterium]